LHILTADGNPPGQCEPSATTNLMVLATTVTPPATSSTSGTLPRTGTNSGELLQIALLLIAVGGLITLAARKRLAHARVDS
jgi:LPXTG-motif cell wall-anchored protein